MKGSDPPPVRSATSEQSGSKIYQQTLMAYDRERMVWSDRIELIVKKNHWVKQELKAEAVSEWFQKYFEGQDARKQMSELTEYYRYYRNSPFLVCPIYQPLMGHYWHKSKTLYYRKIKRELQLTPGTTDQNIADHQVETSEDKTSEIKTPFQLPSQLLLPDANDPDATLRKLIHALKDDKLARETKEETREASKVAQKQLQEPAVVIQTPQEGTTAKSHAKCHLRTNPSQLGNTNSIKKTKKRNQHQSLSSEPRKFSPHGYKDHKLNTQGSSQKHKNMDMNLNYQRRNKNQKCLHHDKTTNSQSIFICPASTSYKQSKGKDPKPNQKSQKDLHFKCQKEKPARKEKVKERDRSNPKASRKKSAGKQKEREQNHKVKAAIGRAKDKIKEEKNLAIKKYIESRQSCNKSSSESKLGDHRRCDTNKNIFYKF